MSDSIAELVHASEQCRPRRGAGGTHVEIIKPHAFIVHAIEVRRF
jgi:hypothetical protein